MTQRFNFKMKISTFIYINKKMYGGCFDSFAQGHNYEKMVNTNIIRVSMIIGLYGTLLIQIDHLYWQRGVLRQRWNVTFQPTL